MNISNEIGFDGVLDSDVSAEQKIELLVRTLETYKLNLANQLRSQPTIFNADPDNDPNAVSGSKTGDVAFWTDSAGVDHYRIL